ncbi:MAG: multicopper oxidase domain-containing protein, partial [Bacteroidota bacterium]
MRKLVLILTVLLSGLNAFSQHHKMASAPIPKSKRLPLLTKHGNHTIYHIYLNDTTVNFTGKQRPAMAINSSIPAPTLEFTEGDTAVIYVHNEMMMEASIHWHGLILPNRYDGVSYLTTTPIEAGQTHLFKFALLQHGTYWYHSHTMTQQQSGLYGAFIIHEKKPSPIKEQTLLLSDWTDENPDQVERRLHNATDWYAIRKGSTQNYAEAIKTGHLKTKLANEWKRMTAMDVSDVYYDRFFSNGNVEAKAPNFKAGDQVKLRVINGSSSTYFWLKWAGGKIKVVANDGEDVQPVTVDRLIIGVAETYDLLITIPEDGSYEFLATPEDRTKHTSIWLGNGAKHPAVKLPRLQYFKGMNMMNEMMDMQGNMKEMEGMIMTNQVMDMNTVMYSELMTEKGLVTLNYNMLKAVKPTTLPPGPTKTLDFELTGNMNRYVWTINNKTVSETDKILI